MALKSEIPDVSSFITSDDLPTVPTKVSELANDKNYISSIPSEYVTETELTAKGYLTSHQDISGLQTKTDNNLTTTSKEVVDAINEVKDMADLILDTEVRLDKTYSSSKIYTDIQQCLEDSKTYTLEELDALKTKVDEKANASDIPTKVSELTNDSNYVTVKAVQSAFGKRNKMRLIAHRGFKSNQPENSYESLHEAAARGYWGVECDIQETSDGEYVIMHDSTVDRTTSGTGEVSSKTLAEIKALTLTDSLYGVPVFEEWLMITKTYGIVPVIEIKNMTDPNKFVQILRDTGVIYNCIVISFEKTALEQVYNIDSKISVSYVVNPMTTDTIDEVIESFGEGNSICPYWGSCTEELIKYAFSKNIEVIPWILNTIEDYSEALKMGLNCIETETFPTGDPLKNDISTGKINIFPNPIIEVEDEPFKLTFLRFVHATGAFKDSGKSLPCWQCRSYAGIRNGNLGGESLLPEFVYDSIPRNGSYQIIKIPEGAERITTDLDLTTYKWTFQQFSIDGIEMTDMGWLTTKSANILDGAKYAYVYVDLIKGGKLTDEQLSTLNSATFNFTIKQKPTRKNYTGSQSVDVNLNGRCAFVISSQYANHGCAYLLLGNYNSVCSVVKLGGSDNFKVTAAHKSDGVDTITVSTNTDYSWYIVYM